MSTRSQFSSQEIQALRERASEAWIEQVPEDTAEGWSKSPVDLSGVVAVFPGLCIKPGFVLRAYQYLERRDGNGVVWAMPEDLPFPEPEECPTTDPPRPSGALDDVMEAIEGDGSPLSYLYASVLWRELMEFGAVGHGVYWDTFDILGHDPWADPHRPRPASTSPTEGPTGTPDEWEWLEPKPLEWSPTVSMDGDEVSVVFHTFSGLGSQRIVRHVDRYKLGSYCFRTDEQVVASGPGGYVI